MSSAYLPGGGIFLLFQNRLQRTSLGVIDHASSSTFMKRSHNHTNLAREFPGRNKRFGDGTALNSPIKVCRQSDQSLTRFVRYRRGYRGTTGVRQDQNENCTTLRGE